MNNTNIESTGEHREKELDKYAKFLGFKIDDELSFKYHIKDALVTLKYKKKKKN